MSISDESIKIIQAQEIEKKREDNTRMTAILRHVEDLSEVNQRKSKANRLLGSLLLVSIIANIYFAGKGWGIL